MASTQINGEKQIQASTLTNDRLVNLTLTNAKVSATAAIDFSKLATLASTNILVGNGSGVATPVAMSGDVTIDNTGATTISVGAIVDSKVSASAAIAFSKLAALTSGNLLVGNGSNVATSVAMSGDIILSNAGVAAISSGVIVDADINASAAISLSKLAEAVIQADGGQAFTGDQSMGGFKLTNLANGVTATDAVTKGQLDSVAAGLNPKAACRVATTAVLSGTMIADGGTPVTGERAYTVAAKTITWYSGEGPTIIDGVTLANDDRILVKDETATSGPLSGEGRIYNGIYVRTSADVWTRSADMDGTPSNEITGGDFTFVEVGTAGNGNGYVLLGDGILTLQTNNIIWTQFSGAGQIVTGMGLSKLGNTLDVGDANKGVQVNADDLQFSASEAVSTAGGLTVDGVNSWQLAIKLDGTTGGNNANIIKLTSNGASIGIDNSTLTVNAGNLLVPAGVVDAGTLDTLDSLDFLRSTSNSSLSLGNTLTISSGATLAIASGATWSIGGTTVTATAAQLNALSAFATREVPTGLVDSSNDTFTLANTPVAGSEEVYVNGIQQDVGGANDYTISTNVITFNVGAIPQTGSKVRVSYRF